MVLIVGFFMSVIGALLLPIEQQRREEPVAVYVAQSEVDNYRMFAFAVNKYLTANPTFVGTLTWTTVKTLDSLPEGQRNANLPPNWKAVVVSSSDYVLCTQMGEQAAGAVGQLFPASLGSPIFLSDAAAVVIPTDAAMTTSAARTEAAKCT
jgi:hypothetical protein